MLFAGAGVILVGGSLCPLWKRILSDDYVADYSFYNVGGLTYEWRHQIAYLGLLLSVFVVFMFLKAIFDKEKRPHALMTGASWLIAIVAFTRIQNAGGHQSLIFLCSYIYILFLGICTWTWKSFSLAVILGGVSFLNLAVSIHGGDHRGIVSKIDLKPVIREDYEDIGIVYQFLADSTVTEGKRVYIIPHGNQYNPDVFRNYIAPGILSDYIPYGSAVSGVHSFPKEFCTAEYVITCDPLCDLDPSEESIVKILDDSLKYLVRGGRFELVQKFVFENGTVFYCYERIQNVDDSEIDYLEERFEDLSEQYPTRWRDILEEIRNEIYA